MKDPDTILDGIPTQLPDEDPAETKEWIASINSVIEHQGTERARFLLETTGTEEANNIPQSIEADL